MDSSSRAPHSALLGESLGLLPETIAAMHAVRAAMSTGATLASVREVESAGICLSGVRHHIQLHRDNVAGEDPARPAQLKRVRHKLKPVYARIAKRPDLLGVPLGPAGDWRTHIRHVIAPFAPNWLGFACDMVRWTGDLDLLWLPVAAGVITPAQKVDIYSYGGQASLLEAVEHLVVMPHTQLRPAHVERLLEAMGIRESCLSRAMRNLVGRLDSEQDPLAILKAARAVDAEQGRDINDDHRKFGLLPPLLRLALNPPRQRSVEAQIMEWLIQEGSDPFAMANVRGTQTAPLAMILGRYLFNPELILRFVRLVPDAISKTKDAAELLEQRIQEAETAMNDSVRHSVATLREDIKAATMMASARLPANQPAAAPTRRRRPGVF